MKVRTALRLLGETVVLVIVWRHAHWSVAMVLTSLTIEGEMLVAVANEHFKMLEDLVEKLKQREGE